MLEAQTGIKTFKSTEGELKLCNWHRRKYTEWTGQNTPWYNLLPLLTSSDGGWSLKHSCTNIDWQRQRWLVSCGGLSFLFHIWKSKSYTVQPWMQSCISYINFSSFISYKLIYKLIYLKQNNGECRILISRKWNVIYVQLINLSITDKWW